MSEFQVNFIQCLFETPVNYDGMEELIKNGYHPNIVVKDLIDSLFCSIDYTDVMTSMRLVKFMVENGLDINEPHISRRFSFYSFVSMAIFFGDVEIVKYLLSVGADLSMQEGFSPLHILGYSRGDKKELFLCLHQAGGDFTIKDMNGETPLDSLPQEERSIIEKTLNIISNEDN